MTAQVYVDARRIADLVLAGGFDAAELDFRNTAEKVSLWESMVLQDKVFALAGDAIVAERRRRHG